MPGYDRGVTNEERPGPGVPGFLVVAALALFGAVFFWLLHGMTRGRMHAPPPETRPAPVEKR